MSERKFEIAEFSLGLFVGAVIGGVAGMLLAPQAGTDTRRKIHDWAADTTQSAAQLVDNAKKALEQASTKAEEVLGLQEKGIKKKLDEIRHELERYDLSGS
ncbi:MAG: YtxH domain-containing protein [Actinobacteria bacterium]|nr:MAG: YtxH domain-containing protein [Actinomycetota bacterium]